MRNIIKFYYSLKGFIKEKCMKKGEYYITKHLPYSRYMYVGNKTFYVAKEQIIEILTYFSQEKRVCKYWEIGILNFKKDS